VNCAIQTSKADVGFSFNFIKCYNGGNGELAVCNLVARMLASEFAEYCNIAPNLFSMHECQFNRLNWIQHQHNFQSIPHSSKDLCFYMVNRCISISALKTTKGHPTFGAALIELSFPGRIYFTTNFSILIKF
jgi:hypothetical protein